MSIVFNRSILLHPPGVSSLSYSGMYWRLWQTLVQLRQDPFPAVATRALTILEHVRTRIQNQAQVAQELKVRLHVHLAHKPWVNEV